jgi:high affinity sulfate transporter 1
MSQDHTSSAGLDRRFRREWLRPDLLAGLTTAAVVVPKSLAYATIAGLPVQIGLYTAFVPMVIYALLGTSRVLSVSTTTTIAILTGSALGLAVPGGEAGELALAAATLAVMVGLILAAASVLRLGFVANFISEPVLTGFKSAIGVVIVVDQIPKLLGIHIHKEGFFRDLLAIVQHVPEASVVTVVLSVALLALIFGMDRLLPKAPAPLLAVALAILASAVLGLPEAGVATIGEVPQGLPALTWPVLGLVEQMWPAALGIALMSFTETIAAGRAFADPSEPRPVPNRELLATGLANAGGGLFGAMPGGGGTSQTAVNRGAGAKSQMAELVTAGVALATLLLLAPVIALMPKAALAAVVIATSIGLIKPADFAEIRRVRNKEFRWAAVAFAGVLVLGTLKGILVAVIVSLVSLASQVYNPAVYALGRKRGTDVFRQVTAEHPDDEQWPGLLMLRVEGRLFFANAERVADLLWEQVEKSRPQVLVLHCRAISDVEYTALKVLDELEDKLRRAGCELWLVGLNPAVFEMVERSKLGKRLGHKNMYLNMTAAVESFLIRGAA